MAKLEQNLVILICFGILCSIFIGAYHLLNVLSNEVPINEYKGSLRASEAQSGTETSLFILIISSPSNFEIRSAIRQTWLQRKSHHTSYRFAVGMASLNHKLITSIEVEQEKYNDLLILPNHFDSYRNLTGKVLQSINRSYHLIQFKFLLKVDDDSYVNLPLFHQKLKTLKKEKRLYWGFFDGRAKPKSKGQWMDKEWNICDTYLPYALGGGYLISRDLVEYLARNSDMLKEYPAEDVSIGAWLAPLNIDRVHDPAFDTEFKSRGCYNEYIVSHKQSIEDMQEKFNSINQYGRLCYKQIKRRLSYIYNWSVPPSKCCIRNDSSIP